jgi:hypothetical protein
MDYMENSIQLINSINEERKLEAKQIQFKKDLMPIMKELKILYDTSTEVGFNEYQATVFSNTYFTAVLASNLNSR